MKRFQFGRRATIAFAAAGVLVVALSAATLGSSRTAAANDFPLASAVQRNLESLAKLVGLEDDGGTPGALDDGKDLLPRASITLDQAIAAAQAAATGDLGEVDLEHYQDHLVFTVDIGKYDVKVDASTGDVLDADTIG